MRSTKQAVNPFLPSYEYIPDAEPRLFDGRVYIYGSHDRFNGKGFCLNDYVCWSAQKDDLADWRYEGVIWKRSDDPKGGKKVKSIPAPDCIQGFDGRYYLYYFMNDPAYIGVAVCDEPAGKYKFYGYVQYSDGTLLGRKKGDVRPFDPGVFLEGDAVYLYNGLCPARHHLHLTVLSRDKVNKNGATVTKLDRDMITIKESPKVIVPGVRAAKGGEFEKHPFFEASSMRKINGKYYFIYSSYLGHELCYAVSGRPDSGFKFGGTLVSIGDIGLEGRTNPKNASNFTGNTHGSILESDGKFYIFYHRQTNRCQFSRQACAEEIFIGENGNFAQAEVTSCGLNGAPLKGEGEYEARIACNLWAKRGNRFYLAFKKLHPFEPYFTQTGLDRENAPDQYIANLRDGSAAGFKYFKFEKASSISILIKGKAKGKVIVKNGCNTVSEILVSPTKNYASFEAPLNISSGIHPLFFHFEGKGYLNFKSFTLKA